VVSGVLLLVWVAYNMLRASLPFALLSLSIAPVMFVVTLYFSTQARKAFVLMAPRAVGLGATQLTFIVVTAVASTFAVGSVTAFNNAFLLLGIPLGVIGVPLGIVVLPTLSRDAAAGRPAEYAGLISRAGKTGLDLQAAEVVNLDVKVGGTLTSPTIQTNLGDVVASAGESVKQAAQKEIAERVDSLKQRADSATDEARKKAQAEAERLIADAEQQAAQIRAEAQRVADGVRREAAARADTLVARTSNPVAQAAARVAAARVKKEANDRADGILREADKKAADLVAEARRKAASISG